MGKVLEMTKAALPLVLALALAACGTATDETAGARAWLALAQQGLGRDAPAAAPQGGLTRAALAQVLTPVDLVTVDSTGASGLIARIGTNAGVETWSSADDKTLSFRNGVLVATRGLGADLMAADVPPLAGLAAGQGSHGRTHVTLTGDESPNRATYACVLATLGPETVVIVERAYATRHVQETCSGRDGSFVNDYWFDGRGILWQSRQWTGRDLGHLTIRRLRDGA